MVSQITIIQNEDAFTVDTTKLVFVSITEAIRSQGRLLNFGHSKNPYGQSANTLIGNYEANCATSLNLDSSKYQGNITTNCPTPVTGGVAVGQENG